MITDEQTTIKQYVSGTVLTVLEAQNARSVKQEKGTLCLKSKQFCMERKEIHIKHDGL